MQHPTKPGTARWASTDDAAQSKDLFVGVPDRPRILLGQHAETTAPIWDDGETGIFTVGPSGRGKGVSAVIPGLMAWPDSFICTDPKGENASVTARSIAESGCDVFVCDPYHQVRGPAEKYRSAFNPLAGMATASELDKADLASRVAEALVKFPPPPETQHWAESARELVLGLTVHCLTTEPPERQNLVTIADYIRSGDLEDFLLDEVARNIACNDMAKDAAVAFLQTPTKERGSVLKTLRKNVAWITSMQFRDQLQGSTFSLADLRKRRMGVFVCAPPDQTDEAAQPWMRLIVNLAAGLNFRQGMKKHSVLLLCDEFPTLGYLPILAKISSQGRDYGMRLWGISQSLGARAGRPSSATACCKFSEAAITPPPST